MVERVYRTEFPKSVKHKPLRINPSKEHRIPSPRYEDAPENEQEIREDDLQQFQRRADSHA
jgi:hypothetical protein